MVEEQLKKRETEASTSGDGDATYDHVIVAEALEENIFEWHFAIAGPAGSDYAYGIYHGRIILPHEYPFKPPDFMMLSPSGRFQVVRPNLPPRPSPPASVASTAHTVRSRFSGEAHLLEHLELPPRALEPLLVGPLCADRADCVHAQPWRGRPR